ncbi:hypothetical protein AMTRI_Chr07g79650 [Amborella trichopoda]
MNDARSSSISPIGKVERKEWVCTEAYPLSLIESCGSVYYSNFGGKFYDLSELCLAPKENYGCLVFVEISENEFLGVDFKVIKNKFVVQWRPRKVLDSASISTKKDAETYNEVDD